MPAYVVRLWVPDRPGALGAVASRIGAVRGDVVGIDILERSVGRAFDELVVSLPDESLVPLLVAEVSEVDGVTLEDVRQVAALPDGRLDALEAAALLVEEPGADGMLEILVGHVRQDFAASWVVVLTAAGARVLTAAGSPPPPPRLAAMGTAAAAGSPDGDVAAVALPTAGLDLLAGREGRPFRARERRQLAALARIADARLAELEARRPAR